MDGKPAVVDESKDKVPRPATYVFRDRIEENGHEATEPGPVPVDEPAQGDGLKGSTLLDDPTLIIAPDLEEE